VKNLFLIDGAAGTGKTDMLTYLQEKSSYRNQIAIIRKYTTRKHRPEEAKRKLPLDLDFGSTRRFADLKRKGDFYSYMYGGELYGIRRPDIERALQTHQHVFVIVRDLAAIQQISHDFPKVCTIPVFIYTDREQCEKRLLADNYDKEAVKFRLERQELAWNDYLKHSGAYREVIINNSNITDFHRLIDSLLRKYSSETESASMLVVSECEKFPLLTSLIGFKKTIQAAAKNYDRNVFLMMKFREENELVYRFIKKQLEENKFNCIRADQREWNITQDIYNPLAVLYCCKYGIALFDEPEEGNRFSPNVAYELGMMHLQGKNCLILRHESLPEMPFDLIKNIHKKYAKSLELEAIVSNWVAEIRQSETNNLI
jgi:guanylate kinase